jgi:hypothetical protein
MPLVAAHDRKVTASSSETGQCELLRTDKSQNGCKYRKDDEKDEKVQEIRENNGRQHQKGDAEAAIDGVSPQ